MSLRPQSAFCSTAFETSFSDKNKVAVLLKGLVTSDSPHVCKDKTNKSLSSPLKYAHDIHESSFFSANVYVS